MDRRALDAVKNHVDALMPIIIWTSEEGVHYNLDPNLEKE